MDLYVLFGSVILVVLNLILTVSPQTAFPDNNVKTDQILVAFEANIASSDSLGPEVKNDIVGLTDRYMEARHRATSPAMLQAMTMAFASSMAEIAVAEPGGGSLGDKTNAITQSLASAFRSEGVNGDRFIGRLVQLIKGMAELNKN